MPRTSKSRADLLKQLEETLRKVGAQSVLLSDTVARLVGVNSTDLECLDLLEMAGPTTAVLAEHAGATTGAMTAVIDRLEAAGYARRVRDVDDRRLVRVEALPRTFRNMLPDCIDGWLTVRLDCTRNTTIASSTLIVDYLTRALALAADHVAWLQTQRPLAPRKAHRPRRARRVVPPPPTAHILRN